MTGEVTIIVPELPGAGGVGDYAQCVIDKWPNQQSLKVLVPNKGSVELPSNGGKVLVQYSAYGFDRHGYPGNLIRALLDWKRQTQGRLVLMFHEIWTFCPRLDHNSITQFFHRRALKKLINSADAVFTTTASQAAHLEKLCPGKSVRVLAVGSNIRRKEDVDLTRQRGWAILFGLAYGRVRALKQMHRSLNALAAGGSITKIITVGAGNGSLEKEERHLLSDLPLQEGFEQRGRQAEDEISQLMLQASYGISAQDILSLEKSGAVMAYAAHGLNIINEAADSKGAEPACWFVSPSELSRGISEAELATRAQRLRAWQQQTSSWERIALAFADSMQSSR